jgi:hypothetical protein
MFKFLMALEDVFYFLDYDTCKNARFHNEKFHNVNPAAYDHHTPYYPLWTHERFINSLILICFHLSYKYQWQSEDFITNILVA